MKHHKLDSQQRTRGYDPYNSASRSFAPRRSDYVGLRPVSRTLVGQLVAAIKRNVLQ